jgi:CHAT domain-containing protein
MFSRLELSRGSDASDDDGRFELHELLATRVASRLVFLSGCETALGTAWSTTFQRGEDYATIALAFLQAGASSVVATLWRIEDRGAAAFASSFYGSLRDRPPAAALALAQRAMLRSRGYSAPYYWAAYQIEGAGDAENVARKVP